MTCLGLVYAKWLLKELLSTGIPGNIKGGTDGSAANGCIAYITAHLHHFPMFGNNCYSHGAMCFMVAAVRFCGCGGEAGDGGFLKPKSLCNKFG